MSLKITLIGAGSVVFAKNLIGDILQFPEFSDVTLCLMDIDPARLKVAEVMANRMVETLGLKARVIATLDQRKAIQGARYVICTVQVGGYHPGTVIDFEIPRKYGLLQTIGDTLGIGGIFRALRTIPVMVSVAQDIAEVGAPGCLLLNYTNPMAMNCMAVERATGIPHVGLCHSVQGTSRQLASFIGLPYEDITYLVAGINHMAFFLKFEYRGQDAYPLLFKLLEDTTFKEELVRFEMMRRTGYFVTESSEHQSEYVPYFIHHGPKMIKQFEVPIDEYLRRCDSVIRTWKKSEKELLGENGRITISPQSNEYGSYIIHSRETNTPRVVYGNVPNVGLIDNLPRGACVELPCLVDAQGLQPTHVGSLPPQLAALCQTNINVQDLTVEAALTHRREHIYHAAMLDPHTATVLTLDKIWSLCDELIAAHQKHGLLGSFAPTIPHTGRAYLGTGDRVVAEAKQVQVKAGRKIEVEIAVTNPGPKPVVAELRVDCRPLASAKSAGAKPLLVKIKVPGNKTASKKVALLKPDQKENGFEIHLSASPAIFTRDYVVSPRKNLFAAEAEGASFEIKLAGFPAAEGNLKVVGNRLQLRMSVDDTKIAPDARPAEGSAIQLYFAPGKGEILPIFLVPQKGRKQVKVLNHQLKPVPGAIGRIAPHGSGYEVHLELPLSVIKCERGIDSFLLDIVVRLSALGDAHSAGETSLSGALGTPKDSSRFAKVYLQKKAPSA